MATKEERFEKAVVQIMEIRNQQLDLLQEIDQILSDATQLSKKYAKLLSQAEKNAPVDWDVEEALQEVEVSPINREELVELLDSDDAPTRISQTKMKAKVREVLDYMEAEADDHDRQFG